MKMFSVNEGDDILCPSKPKGVSAFQQFLNFENNFAVV